MLQSFQARADDQDLAYSVSYTEEELDNLLAPIALYPDPLLAQILPAATYPQEVADAEAWMNGGGYESGIDDQPWDDSIKAIAHYPGILKMLADNMDWTANVGDAFLNQPEEVANSVQRLRWRARDAGNLVSNEEQSVIIEGESIQIVPAQPQYVYVPQYQPSVVYYESPAPGYPPFITFGFGLVIGGWLTMDFDWGHHHIIYHGWNRPGWVNHSRPYVHVRNVYINQSRPDIHETWRHDRSHGDPTRYLALHPSGPNTRKYARLGETSGSTVVQPGPGEGRYDRGRDTYAYSNRGSESRGVVNQMPKPPAPEASQRPLPPTPYVSQRLKPPTPAVSERPTSPPPASPGREQMQQPQRPSSVTFGGYRGTNEARTQSQRGQNSRQSIQEARPPAAPTGHGNVPAGRSSSGDRQRR